MYRIACIAFVLVVQLVIASAAMGATISIAPTSGPVGTLVTFQGVASECAEQEAEDAEVFLLLGPFSASATTNPRTRIELNELGAFSGTWEMPDPVMSLARDGSVRTFPVSVRCIDQAGAAAAVDITPVPASFTYTGSTCTSLQVASIERIEAYLDALEMCLRVALRGTGMDNTLLGNVLANVISGLAGDDVLRGLAGDDVIRGGLGDDRAFGDAGDDRIHGDKGADLVVGGSGNDGLVGGAGRDTLQGGAGSDSIDSNDARGGDVVDGGPGTDTCTVNAFDTVRNCERVVRR